MWIFNQQISVWCIVYRVVIAVGSTLECYMTVQLWFACHLSQWLQLVSFTCWSYFADVQGSHASLKVPDFSQISRT